MPGRIALSLDAEFLALISIKELAYFKSLREMTNFTQTEKK